MGGNCSNCNCNRDEREHELNIEEKNRDGSSKVIHHEQNYLNENGQTPIMNELVSQPPILLPLLFTTLFDILISFLRI